MTFTSYGFLGFLGSFFCWQVSRCHWSHLDLTSYPRVHEATLFKAPWEYLIRKWYLGLGTKQLAQEATDCTGSTEQPCTPITAPRTSWLATRWYPEVINCERSFVILSRNASTTRHIILEELYVLYFAKIKPTCEVLLRVWLFFLQFVLEVEAWCPCML